MPIGFTTVCLPVDLHAELEQLKSHPRQAFHEVIAGLLDGPGQPKA